MRALTWIAIGVGVGALPAATHAAICKYKIEVLTPSMAGYDFCSVSAVNDRDDVVGTCGQETGEEKRAFLYHGGVTSNIGVLPGFNQGFGYGLNNLREVVGFSGVSFDPSINDAHLYRGGVLHDIELWATFPMVDTWANDINDAGEIVGVDDWDHAVYWLEGQDPIYLADYGSHAFGINEQGQIAGSAFFGAERHAVRWDGPLSMVDLGNMQAGGFAEAKAIAENGFMAGVGTTSGGLRAFFYNPAGGGLQAIGTFGGSTSNAWSVSSEGLVVGYAHDAAQSWRGFVWRKGRLYRLNDLLHGNPTGDPWNVFSALDINEKGVILAGAYSSTSTAYLLLHPQSCSLSSSRACCPF
jgi:probable HAF family extracellular repeat protein